MFWNLQKHSNIYTELVVIFTAICQIENMFSNLQAIHKTQQNNYNKKRTQSSMHLRSNQEYLCSAFLYNLSQPNLFEDRATSRMH